MQPAIHCKRINNKTVTLTTEPHYQPKKISEIPDRHVSARHKVQSSEVDILAQTINYTTRHNKRNGYLLTEVYNQAGKYSSQTESKCKYSEDVMALQSKTTTRKNRKQSNVNMAT